MKNRLISHIQSITDPALRRTCESILTYENFFTWSASLSHHHAYEGGLLAHTVEVCDIALGMAGLNISGKLDGAPWEQMLFPKVNRNVLTDTIDAVTHCILAHHGRKEWGSPVEPQTIEALILHQSDLLSAKYGATKDQTS